MRKRCSSETLKLGWYHGRRLSLGVVRDLGEGDCKVRMTNAGDAVLALEVSVALLVVLSLVLRIDGKLKADRGFVSETALN